MTTISIDELREIVSRTRDLPNKAMKLAYLNEQSREVINFLSKNIRMDGIGKNIASEIPKADNRKTEDTVERIVEAFDIASGYSGKLDKARIMKSVTLSPQDRAFVLECLYGSLKLGITVPIPNPVFGDTFRPQLCGTDKEFDAREFMIEEKFDGIRCIGMNIDGKPKLYTRNGKPIVSEAISKEIVDAIPEGYVLDGELVALDGDFQSMKRHSDEIIYRAFDVPFFDHNSITGVNLNGRREILQEVLQEQEHIKISPLLNLKTMRDIDKWIERKGAEGVVAKDPNSLYSFGGRKDWIKVKPWMDVTCRVTGFTKGTGKRDRDDMIGAIEVIPAGSQVKTLVGTGFSDEDLIQMRQLLREQKNVTVDVKYQNLTNDGCLRFPVFLRIREVV